MEGGNLLNYINILGRRWNVLEHFMADTPSATCLRESVLLIRSGGIFPWFSNVMREGLSTGFDIGRPGRVLSEHIFSEPDDCANVVPSLQATEYVEVRCSHT